MERDPFWYGVGITVLGPVLLLIRAWRSKPFSKILAALAITLIVLGAGISFGFLERLLEPVLALVERFAR